MSCTWWVGVGVSVVLPIRDLVGFWSLIRENCAEESLGVAGVF